VPVNAPESDESAVLAGNVLASPVLASA